MTLASERLQLRRGNPDDEFYTPRDEVESIMRHAAAQSVPIVNRNILCPCDTRESAFVQAITADNAVTYSGLPDTPWQETNFHNKFIFTNPPFSQLIPFTQKLDNEKADFLILMRVTFIGNPLVRRRILADEWRVLPTIHGSGMNFYRPDGTRKNAPAVWLTSLPIRTWRECQARTARLTFNLIDPCNGYRDMASADTCCLPPDAPRIVAVPVTWPLYEHTQDPWRIIGYTQHLLKPDKAMTFNRWILGRE